MSSETRLVVLVMLVNNDAYPRRVFGKPSTSLSLPPTACRPPLHNTVDPTKFCIDDKTLVGPKDLWIGGTIAIKMVLTVMQLLFSIPHQLFSLVYSQMEELCWLVGTGKNKCLWFHCAALATPPQDAPAAGLHMTYKFMQAETKLLSALLHNHGLREVTFLSVCFDL